MRVFSQSSFWTQFLCVTAFLSTSSLWAEEAAKPPVSGFLMQLPIFALFFVLFWVAILGPQRKQQKKHQELLNSLQRGDEVVAGGIIGKIAGLTEKVVSLEIAPGTEIKMLRNQVQGKFNPQATEVLK